VGWSLAADEVEVEHGAVKTCAQGLRHRVDEHRGHETPTRYEA
jgi:hypothetical protein